MSSIFIILKFKLAYLKFSVSGRSKQASIHTHVRNAVTLVWGLLRLAPISSPLCCQTLSWAPSVHGSVLQLHYNVLHTYRSCPWSKFSNTVALNTTLLSNVQQYGPTWDCHTYLHPKWKMHMTPGMLEFMETKTQDVEYNWFFLP